MYNIGHHARNRHVTDIRAPYTHRSQLSTCLEHCLELFILTASSSNMEWEVGGCGIVLVVKEAGGLLPVRRRVRHGQRLRRRVRLRRRGRAPKEYSDLWKSSKVDLSYLNNHWCTPRKLIGLQLGAPPEAQIR